MITLKQNNLIFITCKENIYLDILVKTFLQFRNYLIKYTINKDKKWALCDYRWRFRGCLRVVSQRLYNVVFTHYGSDQKKVYQDNLSSWISII